MTVGSKITREKKPATGGQGRAARPRQPIPGPSMAPGHSTPSLTVSEDRGILRIKLGDVLVATAGPSGADQDVFWVWKTYRHGSSPTREGAEELAVGAAWSLVEWCKRQWPWSRETFGPDVRVKGIIEHIRKELFEIKRNPSDLEEWIDVMILAMDGFQRQGGTPRQLIEFLDRKQKKNFARTWPDWRKVGDVAIEHDRSRE